MDRAEKDSRRKETTEIKQQLIKAGFPVVSVRSGKGTVHHMVFVTLLDGTDFDVCDKQRMHDRVMRKCAPIRAKYAGDAFADSISVKWYMPEET